MTRSMLVGLLTASLVFAATLWSPAQPQSVALALAARQEEAAPEEILEDQPAAEPEAFSEPELPLEEPAPLEPIGFDEDGNPIFAEPTPIITPTPPPPTQTPTPAATASPTPAALADVVARVAPSVVFIQVTLDGARGSGSGVVIDGGIITNQHVIEGAKSIKVTFGDGRSAPATVLREDSARDLALLKVDLVGVPVKMEPARQQRIGETAVVIGYPLSSSIGSETFTLTTGIFSAVREDAPNRRTVVQTDAAINPGNSGGGMFNLRGNLVGIMTYHIGGAQLLDFAVAAETVERFLADPIATPTPLVTATPRATATAIVSEAANRAKNIVMPPRNERCWTLDAFEIGPRSWASAFLRSGQCSARQYILIAGAEVLPDVAAARERFRAEVADIGPKYVKLETRAKRGDEDADAWILGESEVTYLKITRVDNVVLKVTMIMGLLAGDWSTTADYTFTMAERVRGR